MVDAARFWRSRDGRVGLMGGFPQSPGGALREAEVMAVLGKRDELKVARGSSVGPGEKQVQGRWTEAGKQNKNKWEANFKCLYFLLRLCPTPSLCNINMRNDPPPPPPTPAIF